MGLIRKKKGPPFLRNIVSFLEQIIKWSKHNREGKGRGKVLISEFLFIEHRTWGEEQEEPGVWKENQNLQVLESFSFRQHQQGF